MNKAIWTAAEAKARFSELVEAARVNGPRTITRNGRTAAVIVAPEESERKAHRPGNLADFFAESPLRGSNLDIARTKDGGREVDL